MVNHVQVLNNCEIENLLKIVSTLLHQVLGTDILIREVRDVTLCAGFFL